MTGTERTPAELDGVDPEDLDLVAEVTGGAAPGPETALLDAAIYAQRARDAGEPPFPYLSIAEGARSGFTAEHADQVATSPHLLAHLKALWSLVPPPPEVLDLADQPTRTGRAHRRLLQATGAGTVAASRSAASPLVEVMPPAPAAPVRRPLPAWLTTALAAAVALVVLAAALALGLTLRNGAPAGPGPLPAVPSPTTKPFVQDSFERSSRNGLGAADLGGPWSISGQVKEEIRDYSTADGYAVFALSTPNVRRTGYLDQVRELSTDVTADAIIDKPAVGGAIYMSLIGRQISYYENYVADVRVDQENRLRLGLSKNVDRETNSPISAYTVVGTVEANDPIHIRLQVFGTHPTTVRAKVWHGSTPEPVDWVVTVTDDEPALQKPGGVGFTTYLAGTATNAPVTVRVPEIVARPVAG